MVASVVFSVILVAGLSVYIASQDQESLYSRADSVDRLGDEFQALAAAEGASALLGVQSTLASEPLPCSSAEATLAKAVGSLSEVQSSLGVTVSSQAALAGGVGAADNMSALRPFNGSVPGDLDVSLRVTGTGTAPGVTLSRTETHYAHLGVRVDAAVLDCRALADAVEGALVGSAPSNCTYGAVRPIVQEGAGAAASSAEGDGFRAGVSFSVAGSGRCEVTFLVTLVQSEVQGPGGPFSARFEEGRTASTGTPTS